jgi:hypothetical protein
MATKRNRGSSWEVIVRRRGILPRPLYLTFSSEEEGDRYVRKLEALLDAGVVPEEFRQRQGEMLTIEDVARQYLAVQQVPSSDKRCLAVVVSRIGKTRLASISYDWAESCGAAHRSRKLAGVMMGMPRKGWSTSRSSSPVMIRSALPLTASSRNLSSFGSRQARTT